MPVRLTQCTKCDGNVDEGALFCPHCGEPVPYNEPDVDPFIGRTVSQRYKVVQRIARGGMGEVYLARHNDLNQRVAVKFLHRRFADDEAFVTRFFNEARSACRVDHPNAVTIYDFGRLEDGTVYIVMEFVDGVPLKDMIQRDGRVEPALALTVAREVAEVLSAAHAQSIIHRDVKPDNIMVRDHAKGRVTVKMLDFGIAKILDDEMGSSLTQTGVTFGTPEYMSPEQASGRDVDARSDIYALGLVIYAMLVGKPPFQGQNKLALLQRHIREVPTPVNVAAGLDLPPVLVALVEEMVEKDPKKRPKSMDEVASRLESIEKSGALSSRAAGGRTGRDARPAAPPAEGPPARAKAHRVLTHRPEPDPVQLGNVGEEASGGYELGAADPSGPARAAEGFSLGAAAGGVVEDAWSIRDDADGVSRFDFDDDPFAAPLPGRKQRRGFGAWAWPAGGLLVVLLIAAIVGPRLFGTDPVVEDEPVNAAESDPEGAAALAAISPEGTGESGVAPEGSGAAPEGSGVVVEGTGDVAPPEPPHDEVAERVGQILGAIEAGEIARAQAVLDALRTEGAGEFQAVVNAANRLEAVQGLVAQIERELGAGECVRADERVIELREQYSRALAMTYYGRLDSCRASTRASAPTPAPAPAPAPSREVEEEEVEPTPPPSRPRGPVRPPREL
jgi:tRNA A-37 threonylcarbamoyl transferase component Bud32